jgi:hypothetical protein
MNETVASFFITKIKGKLSASASLLPPSLLLYHVRCYHPKHLVSPDQKSAVLRSFFSDLFAGLALLERAARIRPRWRP